MPENVDWKLAGWVVVALVVVFVGARSLGDRGGDGAAPVAIDGAARAGSGADREAGVYVDVAGEVRRPGLYRIRAGARVAEALERAGGPTRRAVVAAVNLAARVQDGQQVLVPRAAASAAPTGAGSAGGGSVSLGAATVEQLDQIDGIGPTLARRIVAERTKRGGLRSVDDLRDVEGIGEKRLARLKQSLGP